MLQGAYPGDQRAAQKAGLPVTHPYPPQDLCAAMLSDKKKLGDQIHFVLLESPAAR